MSRITPWSSDLKLHLALCCAIFAAHQENRREGRSATGAGDPRCLRIDEFGPDVRGGRNR